MHFVMRTCLAVLCVLALTATGLWAAASEEEPAAAMEKEMVMDPTTGKMVTAPEYGGTITYARNQSPPTFDPLFHPWAQLGIGGVVESLAMNDWGIDRNEYGMDVVAYTPLFAKTGVLAESWSQPDPLTIILNIRQGVHWHDKAPMNGRELTASDIEYNLHRVYGLGSGWTAENKPPVLYGEAVTNLPVASITATDRYTVVLKLSEPLPFDALNTFLGRSPTNILPPEVIEEHGDMQDWRNVVGTGPFELSDHVENSSLTWIKNPDYWGHDEKYPQNRLPYIDELRRVIMPEQATWLAAFRSGKHDIASLAGDTQLGDIGQVESLQRSNPEITWYPWYFRAETGSVFNLRNQSLFNDIRIRRAMQMAIDLEIINSTYYKGFAKWQPQGMIGDSLTGFFVPFEEWPEAVKQGYRYDPEGAEKLLDEAGYPRGADGIRFKTVLNQFWRFDIGYQEIAVEYWKAIGVDVEIQVHEETAWAGLFTEGDYEGMSSWALGVDSSAVGTLRGIHSRDTMHPTGHQDPVMDAKVDAFDAAATPEEQQRLAREADMYLIEQQWYIWGPKVPVFNASQPWIKGYNGEVELGLARAMAIFARIWIDSDLKQEMGG